MWVGDFEVFEQAEGHVWRGKGTAGEKKLWLEGSIGSVDVYLD
jgi:hypothetical protein